MDRATKRHGSIAFLLMGLVLLLTVAGLFAAFVPCVHCPNCDWDGNIMELGAWKRSMACKTCEGKIGMPLLKK